MSFNCSAGYWIEGLGNPDPSSAHQVDGDSNPVNLFGTIRFLTSPKWNWNHFTSILEMYSTRQITKEADTLDAFLGVINHIRRSQPTTQLLRGLPFFKTSGERSKVTLIDSLEELVAAALSWHSSLYADKLSQRLSTFPSWTWAGWSGGTQFWVHYIAEARIQFLLRHAQLESSSGQIVVSSTLYKGNIQHELDTVTLIQFEAPMIPAISFSITEDRLINFNRLKFTVAGRPIRRNINTDIHPLDQCIENVRKGTWSCLILCTRRCSGEGRDEMHSEFVLVVRWEADQVTAERIGSFLIHSNASEDARLGPFGEEHWTWRRVRLI